MGTTVTINRALWRIRSIFVLFGPLGVVCVWRNRSTLGSFR